MDGKEKGRFRWVGIGEDCQKVGGWTREPWFSPEGEAMLGQAFLRLAACAGALSNAAA